jgi:hypothetical protein
MQLLVQHGADVHNSRGSPWGSATAVSYRPAVAAAIWGELETIKWLHEQGMTEGEVGEALVAAACNGYVPVTQYLLQKCGANLRLYGPDALRSALEEGHRAAVCLLLEAGTPTVDVAAFMQAAQQCARRFNPEQFDTILQAAIQHGHTQLADMLREVRATAK